MKITIYELLGLVKEDKAPLRIKYNNFIWVLNEDFNDYWNDESYLFLNGFDECENSRQFLLEIVEIIEEVEDKEYEDIEPVILRTFERTGQAVTIDRLEDYCFYNFELIENALAKVILNQKKIIKQLKNK